MRAGIRTGWLGRYKNDFVNCQAEKKRAGEKLSRPEVFWMNLELQLQAKLNLARRAEIALGKTRVRDSPEVPGTDREVGVAEVRVVEDVKELCTENDLHFLCDFGALGNVEVGVDKVRAVN